MGGRFWGYTHTAIFQIVTVNAALITAQVTKTALSRVESANTDPKAQHTQVTAARTKKK